MCGRVFKLTPTRSGYVERILYRFLGNDDGAYPQASLLADGAGVLYGTTTEGGSRNASLCLGYGCGIVFRLTR
jgi:hypothetical protein